MMKTFKKILSLTDSPRRHNGIYSYDELKYLPDGVLEQLITWGLFEEIERVNTITCNECNNSCVIEPSFYTPTDMPGLKKTVAYYRCGNEEVGGFFIELAHFHRWRFQFSGLAVLIARVLALKGPPCEEVSDRLWHLGMAVQQVKSREVFLARGLAWEDAGTLLPQSSRWKLATAPILLTLSSLPAEDVLQNKPAAIQCLSQIVTLTNGSLGIDHDLLFHQSYTPLPAPQDQEALTPAEVDILQTLAESPKVTLILPEIQVGAGHSMNVVKAGLLRLESLGLVGRPTGTARKGRAITEKGKEFLTQATVT